MFGSHGVFRATRGPASGHFDREVRENTRLDEKRRERRAKKAIVVRDWNLSSSSSSTSSEDDEEEIVPTQTMNNDDDDATPSQTPEKRRMSACDMSSPRSLVSSPREQRRVEVKTKIICVKCEEEKEETREDVNTNRRRSKRRREEEEYLYNAVYEEIERQNQRKNGCCEMVEEQRSCYDVIPVTSKECLIECSLVFGNQAQADFEERLVERFKTKKKIKVSEVDERENRYELKPLNPVSTKSMWREMLMPSVRMAPGKREELPFVVGNEARKLIAIPESETNKPTARRRIGQDEEYELPTKVDDSVWKDLPENIRNQYLIQVETQKKKNRTEREKEEEEEAVLIVERRSAPNEYRSDTITTKPYQTATNVHNLNPSIVKEKITHALDMQSKERVDGRLNAILHVIRVIRNDLRRTRGREESDDFSDWIQHDLVKSFPGWRAKLCMAVNTDDLIPV